MSTKWSTEVLGGSGKTDFAALLKDEHTVILLRGKNVFGDMIYCYLKVTHGQIVKLKEVIETTPTFNITDYGTVIAAGKGEPDAEVQAEVSLAYPLATTFKTVVAPKEAPAPITEKKAWDEY